MPSDWLNEWESKKKGYTMESRATIGALAVADVEKYLQSLESTQRIVNVEDVPSYQKMGVDLLLYAENMEVLLEVKADQYYHTENYFFEMVSNKERSTPGWFTYSKAEFLLYYFFHPQELHIMKMEPIREWFYKYINMFREVTTRTKVGEGYYTTVGRLVPRATINPRDVYIISLRGRV